VVVANPVPLEEVSVLVVTHDRAALLSELLDSLVRFGGNRWARVVVVDDSSQPLVTSGRFPGLRLHHLVLPGRVHISRAKNLGLAEVVSPVVLIIDDDNTVTDSTLGRPLERLAEEPSLGAVMPAVLYRDAPELVWVYAAPFRPDRWTFELVGRNRPRDRALEQRALTTDALPNAAFFRTKALRSVSGYDERYRVNSSADLCQRLKQAGWTVESETGSFVLHNVEPPGRPGYWAAHAVVDPDRTFFETADWFRFQFAVHRGEPGLRMRVLYHSAAWIVPLLLALAVRRGARRLATSAALFRGMRDGLRSNPD
jgi:GT2 family glycosyltransferase